MLFDMDSGDANLGIFVTNVVDGLRDPNAQAYTDSLFKLEGLDQWVSTNYQRRDNYPGMYFGTNGKYSAFIGGGTENFTQGSRLMQGYASGIGYTHANEVNTYVIECIDQLTKSAMWFDFLNAPNMLICGHSLGGSIAVWMAQLAAVAQPTHRRILVTLGAPKTGTPFQNAFLASTQITRWMNDDDPVPLVPPTLGQVPLLAVTMSVGQIVAFGKMRHVKGGIQLDSDGVISAQVLPTRASINPTTDLATWLVSLANRTDNSHQTKEYRRRLGLRANQPGARQHRQPAEAPAEAVAHFTHRQAMAHVNETVATIIHNGQAQNQGPLVIPPQQQFRSVQIGAIWYTVFGEKIIALGPTRRKAGILAQTGNAFLRKLQRQASADPDGLKVALDTYLTAAQDPASGIKPTLRIGGV